MPTDDATLTVEQLAHETGMSVRNIRNHQSRGLLPPPEVRARVGFYDARHVERLRLILQMQAAGLKLAAIERLLSEGGEGAAEYFMGVQRAAAPSESPEVFTAAPSESPEVFTAAELAAQFGDGRRRPSSSRRWRQRSRIRCARRSTGSPVGRSPAG